MTKEIAAAVDLRVFAEQTIFTNLSNEIEQQGSDLRRELSVEVAELNRKMDDLVGAVKTQHDKLASTAGHVNIHDGALIQLSERLAAEEARMSQLSTALGVETTRVDEVESTLDKLQSRADAFERGRQDFSSLWKNIAQRTSQEDRRRGCSSC